MAPESGFHARLRAAFDGHLAPTDTGSDPPSDGGPTGHGRVVVSASAGSEGVAVEVESADVDPHSTAVVRRAHRRARETERALFATANPTDAFLFRRAERASDLTELDRVHYDLRDLTLDSFAERFLTDAAELRRGERGASPVEDLLVGRLRSFHASLWPVYESLVETAFEEDVTFRERFLAWARENGHADGHQDLAETFGIAARQHAATVTNRVVFCESVRARRSDTGGGRSLDPLHEGVPVEAFDDHLAERFESLIDELDCGDVFEGDDLFESIPDDERTKRRLHAFARSVEREPLEAIDADVAGRLYQTLIPPAERRELGQYYTPDAVGAVLSRWAIRSADDRVLDPACGSGSLTIGAYDRLAELRARPDRPLREQITAVDVNEYPLRLAALNLATRTVDEPAAELRAYNEDFFDIDPAVGTFDATVANPPYVRQEVLAPDRDHFRAHLKTFGPDSERTYYDGEKAIDGRSDLYCYFLTHATRFLREGARLAWVVPTKWMVADYGASLRTFLYDHYKVEAVVGFRKRVFEDALVDTVLLLLERTDDARAREATETDFVRLNEPMSPDDVLGVLDADHGVPEGSYMRIRGRPDHRTVTVAQSHLAANADASLYHYVDAPALYTAVREHDATTPLSELADVTRGQKTGANPIFLLDEDDVDAHGVERRFLRPAIKSVREVSGYEHTAADAERWLLDVSAYVERVTAGAADDSAEAAGDDAKTAGGDAEERVLAALERDGFDGLRSYLRWAETHPSRTNASVEHNDPWFDMGGLDHKTAPVVCPQAMDTRRFCFRTDEAVVPSNRFLLVRPTRVESDLLLGLLNASLGNVVVESHGRVTGGGAVNLSASDLRTLPVVEPAALTAAQAQTVRAGFDRLRGGDDGGRDDIDAVVADVLDLDLSVAELQRMAAGTKRKRRAKGGDAESVVRELDELEGRIEMVFEADE